METYTAIESVHDADTVSSYDEINDDDDDTPIYDDPPVTPHGGIPPEQKEYRLRSLSNIYYNGDKLIRQVMG